MRDSYLLTTFLSLHSVQRIAAPYNQPCVWIWALAYLWWERMGTGMLFFNQYAIF